MKNIKAELIYTITIPKPGENPENCQDACETNVANQRFAISDGVTRSLFPAEWSKLLVGGFVNDEEKDIENLFNKYSWQEWLHPKQSKWESTARERVTELNDPKYYFIRNQYVERKPAAATFIGIRKAPNTGNLWQVMLIGDSCVFHLKVGKVSTYPIKKIEEFDSHPSAFFSYADKSLDSPTFMKLEIASGDYLLLCTDAISKFLIYYLNTNPDKFNKIINHLLQGNEVENFIEALRQDRNYPLESDDVCIAAIIFKETVGERSEIKPIQSPVTSETEDPVDKSQLPQGITEGRKQEETEGNQEKPESSPIVTGKDIKKRKRWFIFFLVTIISIITIFAAFFLIRNFRSGSNASLILYPKEVIVFSPDKQVTLFEATREIPVYLIEDEEFNINGWKKVELDAWFVCAPLENGQGAFNSDSPILIFDSPSEKSDPIGFVPSMIPIVVYEQYESDNTVWCHTKWQGYLNINQQSGE